MHPNPQITATTASPSTSCAGSAVTLNGQNIQASPTTVQIGSGTASNSASSTIGAFYGTWYGNGHAQILIKASELSAAGYIAGNLTELSIDISALAADAPDRILNGFTLKIASISNATTAITTFQTPTFTTVYGPVNYTPVIGLNTHTFTSPFAWDGTSNIIVDYCYGNGITGNGSALNTVTTTSFGSFVNHQEDGSVPTICSNTIVSNTSTSRPNIKLKGLVGVNLTNTLTWNWMPGNLSGSTVTVNPTTTTTYTATATNSFGCSATGTTTVNVNALPSAPIGSNSVQCGLHVPTASVSTGGAGGNGTFKWYANPTGGVALQSSTSATYNTAISSTTNFYVSEMGTSGCESPRTAVTVTVTTPPFISTAGSTTAVCLGGNVTLAANSEENNYVYSWTASPSTGSGISGTLPGSAPGTSSNTVTPTAAGTYTYTVTGSENINGCSASATVITTVNPNPAVPLPTATPTSICAGGNSQLNAGTFVSGSVATPALAGNGSSGNVFNVTATNQITVTSVSMGITAGTLAEVYYKAGGYGCTSSLTSSAGWTLLTPAGGSAITPAGAAPAMTNIPLTSTITIPAGETYGFVVVCNGSNYYTDGATLCVPIASDANISISSGIGGAGIGGSFSFTNSVRNFNGVIGYSFGDPNLNYSWTPAGSLSSPVIINPIATPTTTTAYTVTVSNSFGCSTTSAPVTVTVAPVGANATASPATPVCAGTSVTLNGNPTGGGPFTFSWSDGTTVVGTTNPLTVNPTVTTTYAVTVTDVCGNAITSSVTVTVNPLPTASIAETGPITKCAPATQVLTAVTNIGTASYQWTLNGNNIVGATGATYTVSTVSSGTYRVIVKNTSTNCVSAPSTGVVVTINAQPAAVTITPSSSIICNGGSSTLTASGGTTGGSGNATIGTATTLTGATTQPTAFCNRWPSYRMQTIYTAAELTAAGMSAGNINSMAYNISTLGDGATNPNFTVKIGNTALSTSGSAFVVTTGFTTVFPAATYTHALGVNVINFSTPFVWNGTSNIIVEVIHDGADAINNSQTYYTQTATNMVAYTTTAASNAASFSNQRLNVVFGYSSLQNPIWSWTPTADLNVSNVATVVASPSSTTTYTAKATNSFGCFNTSTAVVNVNPRPTAVISGSGQYCAGQNTTTSLSIAVTGSGPWNGTLSDGTTFSGTTSPISVSVAPTATTTYTVATLTDANCTAIAADLSGSATVTVNPLAGNPTASVTQPTCSTATGTITVTAPVGAGNSYSIDGVQFQSGTTFSNVAPGTYTIYVQNSFGCFSPATASVTVNPQPIVPAAPTVSGLVNVCPFIGQADQITYTASSAGATSYTWTIPPTNVQIISGQGTATLTVKFLNGFAAQPNKQLRVTASSICGTSPTFTIYYLVAQLPTTPNPIAGPTDICPYVGTATTVNYTISKAPGTASYSWVVPSGATFTHTNGPGINDTTIAVVFGAGVASGASQITVQSINDCGVSGIRSITVTRNAPSTPSLITGPTNACPYTAPNGTNATYTVPAIAGVTYTWTGTSGASVVTGQGTNTVTVSYINGFTSGTISVTASTGCGTSAPRSLSITRLNPATPSMIDVIQTGFCGDAGGRTYTYTLSSMPANATSILWTAPTAAGATIVSGQGSTSITVLYPNTAVEGVVTAQAVNNCGASVTRSTSVKLPACPTTPPPPTFVKGEQKVSAAVTVTAERMAVRIFPNPTVSDFKLQVITPAAEQITVRVMDDQGRLYKSFKLMPNQTIALGAELKAGAYLVEVRQGREVKVEKVVKF